MPEGSQAGSSAPGFAWIVAVAVGMSAFGCQRLPVVGQATSPTADPGGAQTTVTTRPPWPEGESVRDQTLSLSTGGNELPPRVSLPPTPMIDAASKRARALEVSARALSEIPDDKPAPDETDDLPDLEEKPAPAAPPVREETVEPKKTAEAETAPAPAAPTSAPHVLAMAIVRTEETKPINPDKPPAPSMTWHEGLEHLQTMARERAGKPGADEDDAAWPLRSRLLDWIAKSESASEGGTLWRTVLTALAASDDPEPSDDHVRSAEIHTAVAALEEHAPFEIADLRICRKVHGFGNFEPLDPSRCRAGMSLIVYSELDGLRHEPAGPMQRSRLSTRVALVGIQGGEAVWKQDLGTAEDVCRRHRRDYYVNFRITLPDNLPPGSYELRLTQTDELARREASATVPVTVAP